ncbi:MAG: hypothetical protein Q7T20_14930 [Saprospiraceae bacterium]|nr:hypothetical protein [Saprospiraceae bacterium]
MRILLLTNLLLFFSCFIISAQGWVNPNSHYVAPHVRSDGTYVKGHHRTNPNSTNRDNYSTLGNVNSWTGQPGWIQPDNKPLPSYSVPSYSPPAYTPSTEYIVPSKINTYPRTQFTSDYSSNPTNSTALPTNRLSAGYSNFSNDLSAGPRVINYKDGRDEFNVVAIPKTIFKRGLTYFSYDVYNHEIKESIGSVEGQLVLHGNYKFYEESGTLRVSESYKNGLKHGLAFLYDENGQLSNKKEYFEGVTIYQKFTKEDGTTFELVGEYEKAGSRLLLSNNSGLYKKIEFLGNGRDHRVEYAPGSQKIIAEYGKLNQELDGPFRKFQNDGKTLLEILNYKNGKLEGEGRSYDENGRLCKKITFKTDKPHGPFEIFNEYNMLVQKGSLANGELHGQLSTYDERGAVRFQETYVNGVLDGLFKAYRNNKPVVNGTYLKGEKQGRWNYYWLDSSQYFLAEWFSYNNGILNGSFQEIKGDSILTGTYKNGLLDGDFKSYQPISLWILGVPPQKISADDLLCSGQYSNGKKTGNWKCYDRTETLVEEGNYSNDLKYGEWRYYFGKYATSDGKELPYSGKLFLIENYLSGLKNGRSERLAYLIQAIIPCDTSIGTVNPLDTCYSIEYQKVREITYYKNDLLHGPLEWRDEAGTLTRKGEYRMGKMEGAWTLLDEDPQEPDNKYRFEVHYENDQLSGLFQKFDASTNILLRQGNYKYNKKNGLWHNYYPDRSKRIDTEVEYVQDKRNISKMFGPNGRLYLSAKYIDGKMSYLEKFDTIKNTLDYKFDNIHFKDSTYNFDLNIIIGDTISKMHLIYESKTPNQEQDPFFFYSIFMLQTQARSENIYATGPFIKKGKGNILLEEGFFQKGVQQGESKYYFYDQNVIRHIRYDQGKRTEEHFSEIKSTLPFSGKFTLQTPVEGGYLIIQVKKGLRHGNTLKYDRQGKLINKTKYKAGKKIEPKSD